MHLLFFHSMWVIHTSLPSYFSLNFLWLSVSLDIWDTAKYSNEIYEFCGLDGVYCTFALQIISYIFQQLGSVPSNHSHFYFRWIFISSLIRSSNLFIFSFSLLFFLWLDVLSTTWQPSGSLLLLVVIILRLTCFTHLIQLVVFSYKSNYQLVYLDFQNFSKNPTRF